MLVIGCPQMEQLGCAGSADIGRSRLGLEHEQVAWKRFERFRDQPLSVEFPQLVSQLSDGGADRFSQDVWGDVRAAIGARCVRDRIKNSKPER